MAKYRKLGRTASQRKALLRNQVTALLNNGKIVTTEAKAKEIRKQAESLIALAVKETRREILPILYRISDWNCTCPVMGYGSSEKCWPCGC